MKDNDTEVELIEFEKTPKEEEKKTDKKDIMKKGKRVLIIIGNILFWGTIVLLVLCAITGFLNFSKVENEQEPTSYREKYEYAEDGKSIIVYNYYIYKIVKTNDIEGVKVSLRLWFLKDYSK